MKKSNLEKLVVALSNRGRKLSLYINKLENLAFVPPPQDPDITFGSEDHLRLMGLYVQSLTLLERLFDSLRRYENLLVKMPEELPEEDFREITKEILDRTLMQSDLGVIEDFDYRTSGR